MAQGQNALAIILLAVIVCGCAAEKSGRLAPLPPLSSAPSMEGRDLGPEYRLLPGDTLRVRFVYHPELDVKIPVRPDGTIAIHGVGILRAEGKTADELAEEVERASSDRLRDPAVTVIVAHVGMHKVYVGGEVRNPGFVVFEEGMTPLQAIFDRGGFTDTARTDSVLKVTGPDATRLDFSKTIREGTPELSSLAANDVLYVPRTFVGDAGVFVKLYFRNLVPVVPRVGVGFSP